MVNLISLMDIKQQRDSQCSRERDRTREQTSLENRRKVCSETTEWHQAPFRRLRSIYRVMNIKKVMNPKKDETGNDRERYMYMYNMYMSENKIKLDE